MELKLAVLFVKDIRIMSDFYANVLGLSPVPSESSEDYVVLAAGPTRLGLHAIPSAIAKDIVIASPAEERDDSPIKLVFTVADVGAERARLTKAGVPMREATPWGSCDGIDPEGNVFQLASR